MSQKVDWEEALKPLIKKYEGKQHPLEYKSIYQLLVMVVLSAQDSDKNINSLAPALFTHFPNMEALSNATTDTLFPLVGKVRNFSNKVKWLTAIAKELKADENIPLTMEGLVALPGIGRKSANVILREAGADVEGIMVDLHVVRVAPRLGIATGTDPKKIELQIMEQIPKSQWREAGMAMSFLGRETCRPSHPQHEECVMSSVCKYYKEVHGS
jgi:endonuclease III